MERAGKRRGIGKEKEKKNDDALQKRARFPARVLPRRRRPAWKHGGPDITSTFLEACEAFAAKKRRRRRKRERHRAVQSDKNTRTHQNC